VSTFSKKKVKKKKNGSQNQIETGKKKYEEKQIQDERS
jgi:hypothetical protein